MCWGGGGLCVHAKCLWVCLVPEAMNNHQWMLVNLDSIATNNCNSQGVCVCEGKDLCACTQFTCGRASL